MIIDIYIYLDQYIVIVLTVFETKLIDDFLWIIIFVDYYFLGIVLQYFDIQNQNRLLFFKSIFIFALLMAITRWSLIFNQWNHIFLLYRVWLAIISIILLILLWMGYIAILELFFIISIELNKVRIIWLRKLNLRMLKFLDAVVWIKEILLTAWWVILLNRRVSLIVWSVDFKALPARARKFLWRSFASSFWT